MRAIVVLLLFSATLSACAVGGKSLPREAEAPPPDAQALLQPGTVPLPALEYATTAQYVRDIQAAQAPPEVDPVLWDELKTELQRVVEIRGTAAVESRPSIISADSRQVSFTPYGYRNWVDDLRITGTGPYRMTWTYRNGGDYDINGSITVSDLTPVGMYFGLNTSSSIWVVARAADGDGDGAITVADITPIGQNFGARVAGYRVYAGNTIGGDWTYIGEATVDINLRKNLVQPRFIINLPELEYEYYALWPFDDSDDEGGWSNVAGLGSTDGRKMTELVNLW